MVQTTVTSMRRGSRRDLICLHIEAVRHPRAPSYIHSIGKKAALPCVPTFHK